MGLEVAGRRRPSLSEYLVSPSHPAALLIDLKLGGSYASFDQGR